MSQNLITLTVTAWSTVACSENMPRCRPRCAQADTRAAGLRHTHITDLLRAGVHPKIASERAGHTSVAITMDIYSHAVPGLQEDAALRIDSALRGLLEY